jgi:hypothetical protein
MDSVFTQGHQRWIFQTPRGSRVVRHKTAEPIWIPPLWHYMEVARNNGLHVARLPLKTKLHLGDGRWLAVRDSVAGVIDHGEFLPLPTDEEIVFGDTLYIPPIGTRNRRITGELGPYMLDLGDGYLLHGTPHVESIGAASTHGCIRLRDEDIAWLFAFVPLGTEVYIY